MKDYTFLLTMLFTALAAGVFFTWSVTVIPGTKKLTDITYLETMQSINKEILNPVFFLVFFGTVLMLWLNTYLHYSNTPTFWLSLVSALLYSIGTFGITAFGNVPLNNELDVLQLSSTSAETMHTFRNYYEIAWNKFQTIRSVAGVLSFISLLLAYGISKSI